MRNAVLAGVGVPVGLLVLGVCWGVLTLNVSPSVPRGLYWLCPVPPVLAVGDLVLLDDPSGRARLPVLKPVAAVEAQQVCVEAGALWIGGQAYGPVLAAESQGRPLPHALHEGCTRVEPGRVFLASRLPRSYDSRYFGGVAVWDLTALATPLVTWR